MCKHPSISIFYILKNKQRLKKKNPHQKSEREMNKEKLIREKTGRKKGSRSMCPWKQFKHTFTHTVFLSQRSVAIKYLY